MKPIALLFTLALGISAFAGNAPDWAVGSYKLELSAEAKATVQKLGLPEPYARIMLRSDGTFSYASNNGGAIAAASGTFEILDHAITLVANGHFPGHDAKSLTGKADNSGLDIDGLHYAKAGSLDVRGTWSVQSSGQIDRSIKMVFKDNHTFEFAGMAATSKGRYEVEGDKLTLTWTEVDGEAVEPGTMRKVVFLREDGFNIDTYRYVRS